jgi:hypothetical protein
MNGRVAKKLRREARREIDKEYRDRVREIADMHHRFLKPRPRWVPEWLWMKGLGIFIHIKK